MVIAVVGKHLRGEPKHDELTSRGARFQGATHTAARYRLYRLPSGLPGLVRVAHQGTSIAVELWWLPLDTVGGFLAGVGAPLSIGRVCLADGSEYAGFLCEAYATADALDITHHGGWRAYLAATATDPAAPDPTAADPTAADPTAADPAVPDPAVADPTNPDHAAQALSTEEDGW
jgi:allophanate hydrolase